MNADDSKSGRLAEKTALITGAGSGIGMQAALLFAAEEANVIVADRDSDDNAADFVVLAEPTPGEAEFVPEPGANALMLAGLATLGCLARWRTRPRV